MPQTAAVALAVASALTAGSAHAGPAGPTCVVSGSHVTLPEVTVHTPTQSFDVHVVDVSAVVGTTGDAVEVAVSGAIAFKGTVVPRIWYAARTEIVSEMVTIEEGARFIGDRADGDEMIGRAVIHASDVLHGDTKEPDMAVFPVRVPCHRLSLDWPGDRDVDEAIPGAATYWSTRRGGSVVLHSEPRDRARGVTIVAPDCEGERCIVFEGVARRGAWWKVVVSNEGVTAAGWVRARGLKRLADHDSASYAYGCTGHHGRSMVMHLGRPTPRPARIVAGTPIFAEPANEVWATVQHEEGYEVVYTDGEPWAEVVSIPGVDLGLGTAFVPAFALSFER